MGTGLNAKLYYGDAGATAATEVKNIKDLDFDKSLSEIDATTRGSGGFKQSEAGLFTAAITGKMVRRVKDATAVAAFTAFETAFYNRSLIAIKCVDDENGSGIDMDVKIFQWKESEPIDGEVEYEFSLKPAPSTRTPTWISGTGTSSE